MTDLEKAKEISQDCYMPDTGFNREDLYASAMEMATWKEQQMIEKACEWLEEMACYYAHWEYNGDTYEREVVLDEEELIKDFKKAMEE